MKGKSVVFKPLEFEWDDGNINKNWAKHQVSFQECEQVFANKPLKIFQDFSHSQNEDRFLTYGITNKRKQLAIIFTIRKNKIRIISARDQNKKERRIYEKS